MSKIRMIGRTFACLACASLLIGVVGAAQQTALSQTNPLTAVLPLTTKSPEAKRLVEEALILYLDRVEQEQSNRNSTQGRAD